MAKVIPLDRFLKLLIYFVIALLCFGFGGVLSGHVRNDPAAGNWMRWLAVIVGTLSVVPWLSIVIGGLALGDEYVHHVALVGTAIAFVGQLLFHVTLAYLREVRLIEPTTHVQPMVVAMALWLLGCGIAALYYRYRV